VKRKGRLYVVCDKVPKHKQRQGLSTQAGGETPDVSLKKTFLVKPSPAPARFTRRRWSA
jgi:hypothetical protein